MKVLVVAHNSFSATRNNGKTLSAIFSAFKKEELCQLFFTPDGAPDFHRCDSYYRITDWDVVHSLLRRSRCGTDNVPVEETLGGGTETRKIKANDVTRILRSWVWSLSPWYSGGLNKWLETQRPDLIFFVGGDGVFAHRITLALSKKLGIPLATYFTDDYVINARRTLYNRILCRHYKKTIQHSRSLFAIGEQMAARYSSFYGRQFLPIMNVIDIPEQMPSCHISEDELHINYFGGLHLGRAEEIVRFGHYMREKVEPNLNKRVQIGVFSFSGVSDEVQIEFDRLNIVRHEGLTGDALNRAMEKTDLFLHVESIEPRYRTLTNMSVSTKIPEYMGMARPILAFGPGEVASFQVIASANDALVISDDEAVGVDEALTKRVADYLNDVGKLGEIARDNYTYASQRFNRVVVSQQFKERLNQKALIFLTMVPLADVSGRGIYTDLLRRFQEAGYSVYVVSPRERRTGEKTALVEKDSVHFLGVRTLNLQKSSVLEKGVGQLLVEGQYRRAIKKYLEHVCFDLVLYSTPPITFPRVISYLKKRNPKVRTYLLLKDIFPQNAVDLGVMTQAGIRGCIYRFFRGKEKKLYSLSDHIGCMSPANVRYLLDHNADIPVEKVEVAPNSLELVQLPQSNREEIRRRYGLPADQVIFIYGGNLGRPQGIDFLIRCLEANAHHPQAHFLVIGTGTELPKLKQWQQECQPSSVTVMEGLPKAEYDELVRACDVGLIFLDYRFTIPNYPSRLLSYLENKMPVLCATDPNTDMGPIAEENGYGYWCESNSVEAFNNLIDKMLHADIKQMGERGYDFLKQNYLVENTFNAIISHV